MAVLLVVSDGSRTHKRHGDDNRSLIGDGEYISQYWRLMECTFVVSDG